MGGGLADYPSVSGMEIRKRTAISFPYSFPYGGWLRYGACGQTHRQTVLLSRTARREKKLT